MTQITEEMKDVISKTNLFSVATASSNAEPNVVPIKFVRLISDDEFLVMDNFMDKTEANMKANPRMAISCWVMNPETKAARAYQFKGDAHFEHTGEIFEEGCKWVKSQMPQINPKAAVIVKVTEIFDLEPHPH